jgi:multiple sugar transport system substrate-binding protein
MKRKIMPLVGVGVFVVLILSCGQKKDQAEGKVTITFWHSFVSSTVPALNELIKSFEAEHPDLALKAQYIPTGDALIQKLITAIQSKTAPDLSWIHADFLEDLVEADAIYKMEDFIRGADSLSTADLQDIYPALLQAAAWKGTLYSLPMEATNLISLDAAGQTPLGYGIVRLFDAAILGKHPCPPSPMVDRPS